VKMVDEFPRETQFIKSIGVNIAFLLQICSSEIKNLNLLEIANKIDATIEN